MRKYFSLVKFSHTIFALPFALLGFFLGTVEVGQGISWRLFFLVLLCMVFARSAAMAFNRYLDRDIDGANPRTASREIPAGKISPESALRFTLFNAALFVLTCWFINPLCFALSPVALLVILGYSYTKRFTALSHFVLGLGLALAPIGAYLAAGGGFDPIPLLYATAVWLWVSGFDIIYALQDEQFDRDHDLHSLPSAVGKGRALRISKILHVGCAALLVAGGLLLVESYPGFGVLHWCAVTLFIVLLAYQHALLRAGDLSRINLAFFTTNGIASLFFGGLVILDIYV